MSTLLLVFLLVIEFFLAYFLSERDFFSPAVIFTSVFLMAVFDLITMMETWSVSLEYSTVLTISTGIFLFIITSCSLNHVGLDKKRMVFLKKNTNNSFSGRKNIETWKLLFFLFLNIITVFLVAYKVVYVVRETGYVGNVLACIGRYSHLSKFTTYNLGIGTIPSNLHQLCEAQAYIWGFILIDKWFKKEKLSLIFMNFIVTTLSYFLYGSRSGAVFVIISLIPAFVLCYRKNTGKKRLKTKYIIYAMALILVLMLTFQQMGAIINRTLSGTSFWEYVSIYLGAPVLNLDFFLQQPRTNPPIWGANTFATQINYLRSKLGMSKYNLDLPFRSVNGHNLGNVYTTFYPYIKDFGYIGMCVLVILMAAITQIIYKYAKKNISKKNTVSFSVLVYMYIFPLIAFSFFSNKFYEGFGILFVKEIIYWLLIPWFLYKFKLSVRIDSKK